MSNPHVAQKSPIAVELTAGTDYYWCSCGKSAKQPFCDGSHAGSEFTPLKFQAQKTGTAYLCACKATSNKPYCDGTHSSL